MTSTLRIATRRSALALWQATHVAEVLRRTHPGLQVELVPLVTEGDRRLSGALSAIGGKGLFVKELEQAMLNGQADLAVHSMKDVPATLPDGLCLAAFLESEDPRDAFVSNNYGCLEVLPQGARVGTSSLRRRTQVLNLRPDLDIVTLRGNLGTRLQRMDKGHYQAILLACAGLTRLELSDRIGERFPVDQFVPAIAQGIIGLECRTDDWSTRSLVKPLHHMTTAVRVTAERALGRRLGSSCAIPVAGHARVANGNIHLIGLVGSPDGSRLVRAELSGRARSATELGIRLAEHLLTAGAEEILSSLESGG